MIKPELKIVRKGVIEALRDATRSRHASLAASPSVSRLFDADYTIEEYRAHLSRLLDSSNHSNVRLHPGRIWTLPGLAFADRATFDPIFA